MSIDSDIFIASSDNVVRDDIRESMQDDGTSCKSLTPAELSTLWAALEGHDWDESRVEAFECLREEHDGEVLFYSIPDAMRDALCAADEALLVSAVEAWAQTDELSCEPDDIRWLVDDLARLAKTAAGSGVHLYLRLSC